MRSSLLLSAVCAATGVIASPVEVEAEKRAVETEWSYWTVTTTSTAGAAAATGAQDPQVQVVNLPPTTTTLPPVIIGADGKTQGAQQQQAQPTQNAQQQQQQQQQQQEQQKQQQEQQQQQQEQQQQQQQQQQQAQPTAWTSSWSTQWTSGPTQAPSSNSDTGAQTQHPATNKYQETLLYNHNVHRSNHSAPSLTWSDTLQASAQKLAAKCVYEHNTDIDGGGYGQNIGYGVASDNIGEMITNLMYNDEMGFFTALYGLASPLMELFDSWGHFSQIVWKSTKEVGCATVMCDTLGNVDSSQALPFTVCNYSPAGNANGEYADNVLKPLGQPMLSL